MGARGGPCPRGGTLLKAGWQEAGLPRGQSARPGVRLLREAASKATGPASSGQKNAKASSQAPGPRTHAHSVRGRGPQGPRAGIPGGRVGGGPLPLPLPCAARVQTGSPGGGHGLGLVPRAVEPPEEGSRIQPLKAPGAAGDRAVVVGGGVGPAGRQRGQSGQLAVPGEGRSGPWRGESVTSHPSPAQGCPGGRGSGDAPGQR